MFCYEKAYIKISLIPNSEISDNGRESGMNISLSGPFSYLLKREEFRHYYFSFERIKFES